MSFPRCSGAAVAPGLPCDAPRYLPVYILHAGGAVVAKHEVARVDGQVPVCEAHRALLHLTHYRDSISAKWALWCHSVRHAGLAAPRRDLTALEWKRTANAVPVSEIN